MSAPLREGFTTGTGVAAAAKAAVEALLLTSLHEAPLPAASQISVLLPPFDEEPSQTAASVHKYYKVPLEAVILHGVSLAPEQVISEARVIKDGGDDPDATHGARICVYASFTPFTRELQYALGLNLGKDSFGSLPPLNLPTSFLPVTLQAGAGVGVVTLPGLPVSVGEPAINPVPRKQIARAVEEAAKRFNWREPLYLWLFVPDGEARAVHTLNPRLGILGGISILGTQGTVRPYSHDAWQATISQGLSVAKAAGLDTVLFSTGRRSERALFGLYPALPALVGVQAADFAAYSIHAAVMQGFRSIVWGCFMGKLLKLAQKLEYTHAKTARSDFRLLADLALAAGVTPDIAEELLDLPTAVGAFALLDKHFPQLAPIILRELATLAFATLNGWAIAYAHAQGTSPPTLTLHVFSMENELLLTLPASH